jgi:alkyl sulfatase BDS1-like metallo-beta-lactamase superfamily hydrolase
MRTWLIVPVLIAASAATAGAQGPRVVDLGGGIFQAIGAGVDGSGVAVRVPQSNTFVVTTPGGHVVIDTSLAAAAPAHRKALASAVEGEIKAIILTHGHGDHTGGVQLWRQPATQVIAQRRFVEFLRYQTMLRGYFARSNTAQFGGAASAAPAPPGAAPASAVEPTVLFDETYAFDVGGVRFELLHTPGETPDHLTVWVPSRRAAFIGDNFYQSFPNLYTLRGTQPRWALEYVASIDRVIALDPEIVLPSHGPAIRGRAEIRRQLTRYRDAIQYVHDATVAGMNEGKSVLTLMNEIALPPALDIGESYGKISWSVRGIYEGYVGWFDRNPSTMFGPPSQAYGEMVALAGGADAVAARARALVASDPLRALYLTDMALAADAGHRGALDARLQALEALDARSTNSNERGWLAAGIRDARARLER